MLLLRELNSQCKEDKRGTLNPAAKQSQVAEVGSVEVARDPEVCALRAANKRLAQELDILTKALASNCRRRSIAQPTRERVPTHRPAAQASPCASVPSHAKGGARRVLRLAAAPPSAGTRACQAASEAHSFLAPWPALQYAPVTSGAAS